MNVSTNGGTVFNWFVNITSITGLITWDIILITYVRFHQGLAYHGIDRDTLPYKAPLQPYASYFGIFWINLIIFFNGFQVFLSGSWNVNTFITAYICLPIFLVFYLGWKIVKRPKFVRIKDMDFVTGRRELNESEFQLFHFLFVCYRTDRIGVVDEQETAKYVEPQGVVMKIWDWISECRSYSFNKLFDLIYVPNISVKKRNDDLKYYFLCQYFYLLMKFYLPSVGHGSRKRGVMLLNLLPKLVVHPPFMSTMDLC